MWLSRPSSSLNHKIKSLFTPWKLESIRQSKYLFPSWFVVLARYLFQVIVLLQPNSNFLRSSLFSWVDKVTTGAYSLVSFIYVGLWLVVVPATIMQFLEHFNWRLISQLIIGISSVLPKLPRYFNRTIISISFVPPFFLFVLLFVL